MEEVDVESTDKLNELAIDVQQSLVVGLQGFHQRIVGVDDSAWHDGAADCFQARAPGCEVRAFVWSAKEQNAVCRDEYGSKMFSVVAPDLRRIDQGSLDDESTQRMSHENDWSLCSFPYASVGSQLCNKMLGMVVYPIPRRSIRKRRDIGIVPVHQNPYLLFLQYEGQQLRWPEDLGFLGRPCVVWISVQTVHEYHVHLAST